MPRETETYVLFEVAGTTYALESAAVQHVEMAEHVTTVPNAHRAIDGVVFSRGQILPALNLRVRFGFEREDYHIKTRILFTQIGSRTVGLVVDNARDFRKIRMDDIRPIEQALTGLSGNYLRGLTTINDKLVLLLNMEAVLNLEIEASVEESLATIEADNAKRAEVTKN